MTVQGINRRAMLAAAQTDHRAQLGKRVLEGEQPWIVHRDLGAIALAIDCADEVFCRRPCSIFRVEAARGAKGAMQGVRGHGGACWRPPLKA